MTTSEDLRGLIQFAKMAGFDWREPSEAVFEFMSVDPDFVCFREGDQLVVRKLERGVYSKPLIAAARLEEVEKYLSFLFGLPVREKLGLARIWLESEPVEIDTERDGYRFSGTLADVDVSWNEDGQKRRVSALASHHAAKFAIYSRFSAEEIRSSFLQADGHPLFTS